MPSRSSVAVALDATHGPGPDGVAWPGGVDGGSVVDPSSATQAPRSRTMYRLRSLMGGFGLSVQVISNRVPHDPWAHCALSMQSSPVSSQTHPSDLAAFITDVDYMAGHSVWHRDKWFHPSPR